VKLMSSAMFVIAIAACAVEPAPERETSSAISSDESDYGGVADCGTKDTPPCPMDAVSAPQGGVRECGTSSTPPCPAPASSPQYGGLPQCGTPNTPPCPIAPAPLPAEWQACGTKDTPPCPSS